MAVPVARVHLKMAHAALPALLPTPPKWKMLPPPPLPAPCLFAVLPAKPIAKPRPSRADSDERWDAHKTKSPSSSSPRSTSTANIVRSCAAGHGSSRKSAATTPPPKPGRADSVERWDAQKKAASPASSPSSSPGTSSLASSRKWPVSCATSAERWDVHKKRCLPQAAEPLDDGGSSSTGSNDIDDTEEEILWKPRAMHAGPGFAAAAAPEPAMLPMPTSFLVPVA